MISTYGGRYRLQKFDEMRGVGILMGHEDDYQDRLEEAQNDYDELWDECIGLRAEIVELRNEIAELRRVADDDHARMVRMVCRTEE